MRITIVQGAFFPVPPIRGGAVEKLWYARGQEFAARGHTVTHISRLCDGLPPTNTAGGVVHRRVAGYDQPTNRWLLKWRDPQYSLRACRRVPISDVIIT